MEENKDLKDGDQKNKTSIWATIIAIAIVAIVFACVYNVLFPSDNSPSPDNNPSKTTYYIGDTVKSGSTQFRVTSVKDTNQIGSELLGETTSANFIIVSVTITNTGNSEISLTSSNFSILLESSTYEPHTSGIYLENGFYALTTIGSKLSTSIDIVFETPSKSTAGKYYISLKGDSYFDKKVNVRLANK